MVWKPPRTIIPAANDWLHQQAVVEGHAYLHTDPPDLKNMHAIGGMRLYAKILPTLAQVSGISARITPKLSL